MRIVFTGLCAVLAWAAANSGVPARVAVEQFREGQLLEFPSRPNGEPVPYKVYALSRYAGSGLEMKPLDRSGRVVNTASETVELRPQATPRVTMEYVNQQVAYVRVRFSVGVQQGTLTRTQGTESRNIASMRPGNNLSLAWGLGWVGTFGLLGIVAWPNNTAVLYHDETVPVHPQTLSITYSVGGGGGCLAFSGAHDSIVIHPSELEPGYLYEIEVGLRCGGLFQGNVSFVGQKADIAVAQRIVVDGGVLPDPRPAGYYASEWGSLQGVGPVYSAWPVGSYSRRDGFIDRGVYPTRRVPFTEQRDFILSQVATNLREVVTGAAAELDRTLYGYRFFPAPDHPGLGAVALGYRYQGEIEGGAPVRLYRVLSGSLTTTSFSLGIPEPALPVQSINWEEESVSEAGQTWTRRRPVYQMAPVPTPTVELPSLRLATVVECSFIRGSVETQPEDAYYCPGYGTWVQGSLAWQ